MQISEALLYADFLRMVLEIIATGITCGVQHNPHLIYTILHKREILAPFRAHAHFAHVVRGLDEVCVRAFGYIYIYAEAMEFFYIQGFFE